MTASIAAAMLVMGLAPPFASAQSERVVAVEDRDAYVEEFNYDPDAPPVIDGVKGLTEAEVAEYKEKIRQAEASGPPQDEIVAGQMWSDKVGLPEGVDKADADQSEVAIAKERAQPQTRSLRAAAAQCKTFWLTPHRVCGSILTRYEALGGMTSWLLLPIEGQKTNPDGQGTRQRFAGGFIYSHPTTGTHAVANHTANVWQRHGWEAGWLGYPLGGEVPVEGSTTIDGETNGWMQRFQGGRIYRAPILEGFQIASINGVILDKWLELGGPNSELGFPMADEAKTADGVGRFSTFQNGVIYWHPSTGAHPVQEPVLSEWARSGYEVGEYGYPLADATVEGDILSQQFQYGVVEAEKPNPLMVMEDVPFIKFDTANEAWDFFARVEQGLEELPSLDEITNQAQLQGNKTLQLLNEKQDREYGPCLLTVPNPHIRTSWAEYQNIRAMGVKPMSLCAGRPLRIEHQTFPSHGIGGLTLGHVPNIKGDVDIPSMGGNVPQRHRDKYDTRYESKDSAQPCDGDNKRWYRGLARGWITTNEGTYYAQAYSNLVSENCSVHDSIL